MKKRLSFLVSLLMILGSFALVGCDTNNPVDDGHHYATEYSSDGTYHFFACTDPGCTARKGEKKCSGGTATCVGYAICDVCGNTHGDFDLNNHDLEHHEAQEPTETEVGWEAYDTCRREGCNYTTYVEIPATGPTHHFSEEWTSENGTHFHVCTDPGCSATTEPISCSGGEATCVEQAICDVCYHYYGNIDPNNHSLELHVAVEPGCNHVGWYAYENCCNYGCDYTTYREIPATGNHHYVNGTCEDCGAKEPGPYTRIDKDGTPNEEGEYLLFGSYPQTDVTNEASSLGLDAGGTPRYDDFKDWTMYDYYRIGKIQKYMWYKDVELNGNTFRAVYFNEFRPKITTDDSSANTSNQDDNGYYYSNVYWFKFEPIKWQILEENDGKAVILCNMAIDAQAYQNTAKKVDREYFNKDENVPEGTYANNYEYSSIRKWLNDTFYNTAFTELQKELIVTTTIKNDLESTGFNSSKFVCNDTKDNVFLISRQFYRENLLNIDFVKIGTDYALSQGLRINSISSTIAKGACYWWTRTSYFTSEGDSSVSITPAKAEDRNVSNTAGNGVVPAITINLN